MEREYDPNDRRHRSWVSVPEGSDFSIQNLPYGVYNSVDHGPRAGVAIGDYLVDRLAIEWSGRWKGRPHPDGLSGKSIVPRVARAPSVSE